MKPEAYVVNTARGGLVVLDHPVLGPFGCRSEALDAERRWLEAHWLIPDSDDDAR
jgi:hypothetical protein